LTERAERDPSSGAHAHWSPWTCCAGRARPDRSGSSPPAASTGPPEAAPSPVRSENSVTAVTIGVGRAYYSWRIAMLVEGRNIEIVGLDGSPLRRLVLDPTKDYQRIP
jgi:hypothetical protein